MSFAPPRLARLLAAGTVAASVVGTAAAGLVAAAPATAAPAAAVRNLVANPSAETVTRGVPKGWVKGYTGVNRSSLTVVSKGAASGRTFVRTRITAYRSGGAWWATPAVAVRGGGTYQFTESYRSGATTRVLAGATVRGKLVWLPVATARPAGRWTKVVFTLALPAGTTSVRFAHTLRSVGYLDVDAVALVPTPARKPPPPIVTPTPTPSPTPKPTPKPTPTPTAGASVPPVPSSTGLVSLTFDDGTSDHYTQALPALRANGQVGTFYLISGYLGSSNYLTVDQARALRDAGNEIGSHTVAHPKLTTLTPERVNAEFAESKRVLESHFGPVTSLAYPYGSSDDTVRQIASKYYTSARSTDGGLNVTGSYDRYRLTIGYVFNTTSVDTVKQWVADAKARNQWLILCYHGISDSKPNDPYSVTPSGLAAQLAAVKSSGVRVVTVRDGLKLTGR